MWPELQVVGLNIPPNDDSMVVSHQVGLKNAQFSNCIPRGQVGPPPAGTIYPDQASDKVTSKNSACSLLVIGCMMSSRQ